MHENAKELIAKVLNVEKWENLRWQIYSPIIFSMKKYRLNIVQRFQVWKMIWQTLYTLYIFRYGCYRETPSHAYEDKDNRNTFQGLRCGYSRSYGGNKTANTQRVHETRGTENSSSSLLFASASDSKSFTMLFNNSGLEKGRLIRLYDLWHIVTFIQLSILSIIPAKISTPQIRTRSRRSKSLRLTILTIRKRSIKCVRNSHFFDRPIMRGPRDPSDLLTLCTRDRMRFREVFTERDVKFTNISVQCFPLKNALKMQFLISLESSSLFFSCSTISFIHYLRDTTFMYKGRERIYFRILHSQQERSPCY